MGADVRHKAQKLNEYIDESDIGLFGIMGVTEALELSNKNQKFELGDTIITLQKTIVRLAHLFENMPSTNVGEALRLGKPSKDENVPLDVWLESTFSIWTKSLGRTTRFDKNGVNGRKRCVNFLYDCLQPLHPEVNYTKVRNALNKHLRQTSKVIPHKKTSD